MNKLEIYLIFHAAGGLPLCWYLYNKPPRGVGSLRGWFLCFIVWPILTAVAIGAAARHIYREMKADEADQAKAVEALKRRLNED